MKRALDLVAASFGLLVCAPLFVLIAVWIKLDSGGPVFFRQERVGRRFRPFRMFKFRTMVVDAASRGPGITVHGDARITRAGRVLRRTKLDELPQLLNVALGHMSLVGARPELLQYVEMFRRDYAEILRVRPGITDAASIAYRNESELLAANADPEQFYVDVVLPDKLRLARGYVRRGTIGSDVRLIATTVLCLVYPGRVVERMLGWVHHHHRKLAIASQAVLIALANVIAFQLRFEGAVPPDETARMLGTLPLLLVARLAWLHPFGLFEGLWRYVRMRDMRKILGATLLSSVTFHAVLRLMGDRGYPRSIEIIDALLVVMCLGGIRFARRVHDELRTERSITRTAVVVGTADAAERVLTEILEDRVVHHTVLGLVCDVAVRGLRVHDVPILGTYDDLERAIAAADPDEIIVASPADPGDDAGELLRRCRALGRPVKAVSRLRDVLAGRSPGAILGEDIDTEALLFRAPIQSDPEVARAAFAGRVVMVTGAGGSIGSEICRQLAGCAPSLLILFERHEESLYEIEKTLRHQFPGAAIEPVIGDVTNRERVEHVVAAHRPHAIFHAAAYKHVPMMERNVSEAFRTNVIGTRTMAEVARDFDVEAFVLISTDKAVEPMSAMGTTKRIAELAVEGLSGTGATRFLTVRFGNVLDSSGSVVPLFREQIERGGPVTVTHADATRLFMTIPEAVQLILQAATLGRGGEIFVLDMGRPVRIVDMAEALIRLYGLRPNRDIPIVFTGLRSGERLFEKLFNDHERVWKTAHPKILMATAGGGENRREDEIRDLVLRLEGIADEYHAAVLRRDSADLLPPRLVEGCAS